MERSRFFRVGATNAATEEDVTLTFSADRIGRIVSSTDGLDSWWAIHIGGEMYYISEDTYEALVELLDVTDI